MKILSDEERQIVTLYAVSGFKHREIAGFLDIPLPTVLSRYNRALKKLRKYLTESVKTMKNNIEKKVKEAFVNITPDSFDSVYSDCGRKQRER